MADNNQNPPGEQQEAQNAEKHGAEQTSEVKQPAAEPVADPVQVTEPQEQQAQGVQQQEQQVSSEMPEVLKKADNQPGVTQEEKLLGLASYIPLVSLVTMLVKPDSKFIMLHGRQGLLISAILILGTLFLSILYILIPIIGAIVLAGMHIGLFVVIVFSMYQAFIGNWWKIPVLGAFADMIPVQAFTKVTREAVMGDKGNNATDDKDQNSADSTIEDFKQQTGNEESGDDNAQNAPENSGDNSKQ